MSTLCSMLTFEVPIGGISVAESGGAVIAISMGMAGREEFQQALLQRGYSPRLGETTVLQSAHRQLTEYFSGRRRSFSLPFRLEGTAFQKAVWQVLSTIPYGETRSYGEVAAAVARPKGARAVGQAVGSNRLGILIPCHRVVAAGGKLGGFGCGLEMKKFLLQLEREHSTPAMRE